MSTLKDQDFLSETLTLLFEFDDGTKITDLENSMDELLTKLDDTDDDEFNIRFITNSNDNEAEEKIKVKIPPKKFDDSDNNNKEVSAKISTTKNINFNIPSSELNNDSAEIYDEPTSDTTRKISANDTDEAKKFILKIPNKEDKKLKVTIPEEQENEKLKVNIPDNNADEKIKITIPEDKKKDNVIKLKLSNKSKDDKHIKLKIKGKDVDINDALSLDGNEELKKLLKNGKPNELIANSLEILMGAKRAVDRLIVLVPNDNMLVKTQNVIVELISKLTDTHETLTSDKNKCQDIAISVAKFIIDLKSYLKMKFYELKDDVDESQHSDDNLDSAVDKIEPEVKKINKEKEDEKNEGIVKDHVTSSNKPIGKQTIAGNNQGFGAIRKN